MLRKPYCCPVCNGLEQLQAVCPHCGAPADDEGRLNDYLGPYAPYRDLDDVSLTNGFNDLAARQCIHVIYCQACGETDTYPVGDSCIGG